MKSLPNGAPLHHIRIKYHLIRIGSTGEFHWEQRINYQVGWQLGLSIMPQHNDFMPYSITHHLGRLKNPEQT